MAEISPLTAHLSGFMEEPSLQARSSWLNLSRSPTSTHFYSLVFVLSDECGYRLSTGSTSIPSSRAAERDWTPLDTLGVNSPFPCWTSATVMDVLSCSHSADLLFLPAKQIIPSATARFYVHVLCDRQNVCEDLSERSLKHDPTGHADTWTRK